MVHGIASEENLGQISETSVSFHLKVHHKRSTLLPLYLDDGIRRYHAILYGLCTDANQ
jgi:hypothetical protein